MSSELDNILDSMEEIEEVKEEIIVEFTGIDPRLKLMSYSSGLKLHGCPRRYELYKYRAMENPMDTTMQQVTFDFGHVVGQGLQDVLEHKSEQEVMFRAFMMWSQDLYMEDEQAKKSFWRALVAIKQFISLREHGYLKEYELMTYNGKPAVELGFRILMENGFEYRGFVDAVLRHMETGAIVVLEGKTTKYKTVNPAQFKNSAQAVGYSVVLDFISPGLSDYTVLYLVYSSTIQEYIELPFAKTFTQRAHWLRNLLLDQTAIETYINYGDSFPMHGENCYSYFRECEYLSLCNMDTDKIAKPLYQSDLDRIEEDRKKYQFVLQFKDLIQAQLEKQI